MKKTYTLLALAALLAGCGDKDKFLFTQISTGKAVNEETKTIVKNNSFVYATLDSTSTIRTLGSKISFNSGNQFQTFAYNSYTLPTAATTINTFRNTVVFATGTYNTNTFYYSKDYGFTFDTVSSISLTPAMNTSGFTSTELVDVAYLDDNTLMLLYIQKLPSNLHYKQFFKLNIKTKQADSVYRWQDKYSPVAIKFADSKKGWMVLYSNTSNGTFIERTADGGKSWTNPKTIDNTRNMPLLQLGSNGNMTVAEAEGNACFSADSGNTWKKTTADIKFNGVQKVDKALAYGVNSTDGLVKSTDSGQTWTPVPGNATYEFPTIKNISFKDDKNGIMYGSQKMLITADGGTTWKIILYPYPYIVD